MRTQAMLAFWLAGTAAGAFGQPVEAPAQVSAGEQASPEGPGLELFCGQLTDALQAGDKPALASLSDLDGFFDRVFAIESLPGDMEQEVRSALKGQMSSDILLGGLAGAGGRIRFLHAVRTGTGASAFYRLMGERGGVRYFQIALLLHDGGWRAADLMNFAWGSWMSDAVATTAVGPMADALEKRDPEKAVDKAVAAAGKLKEAMQRIGAHKYKEALEALDSLRYPSSTLRIALMLRLQASIGLADAKLVKSSAMLARKHLGDDPAVSWLMVDWHYTHDEPLESVAAIRSMAAAVGGDPYLDYLIGNGFLKAGKKVEALEAFRAAMAGDPELEQPLLPAARLLAATKDYGAAVAVLRKLAILTGSSPAYLGQLADDGSMGLVESQACKDWIAETPTPR